MQVSDLEEGLFVVSHRNAKSELSRMVDDYMSNCDSDLIKLNLFLCASLQHIYSIYWCPGWMHNQTVQLVMSYISNTHNLVTLVD